MSGIAFIGWGILCFFAGGLIAKGMSSGDEKEGPHVCGSQNHRFEPRYDMDFPDDIQCSVSSMDEAQLDALKDRTYVHDVCERCGNVVRRVQ
ncbi:MAG: hypothetical protein AABY22_31745 [Nanoarchaeota archaeon]